MALTTTDSPLAKQVAQITGEAIAEHRHHQMLRFVNATEGKHGCGVDNCQKCADQDRQWERAQKYRGNVEQFLRSKLGDRVFESLSDKGFINLSRYY